MILTSEALFVMVRVSKTILRLEYMDASNLTLLTMEIIPKINITLFLLQIHNRIILMWKNIE